jgi:hypothetical protein
VSTISWGKTSSISKQGRKIFRKNVGRGSMKVRYILSGCLVLVTAMVGAPAFAQTIYGPYGGRGGIYFEDVIPHGANIVELQIRSGAYIDAIQVFYETGGQRVGLARRGGNGGQLYRFVLQSGEFIRGISGKYGAFVDSLTIHTNLRSSPRYGGIGGAHNFHTMLPSGHVLLGFVGRAGQFVDAIGIIAQP